jgi:hypothetical protein
LESQSADCGNWLAAILLPISTVSHSAKPFSATNHRTGFQQEMLDNFQL